MVTKSARPPKSSPRDHDNSEYDIVFLVQDYGKEFPVQSAQAVDGKYDDGVALTRHVETSADSFRTTLMRALVVGASRGLGLELVKRLRKDGADVYATVRSKPPEGTLPSGTSIIESVDVADPDGGNIIVRALDNTKLDLVIINAGYFVAETLKEPSYAEELEMYKTVAIGPVFLVHHLQKNNVFAPAAKLILITTEGGSITLRTPEEGGGNFGHHGSKAAANMVGKLLACELQAIGVTVVMIHPGFMRTAMTKNVGYDKFWDSGGAVEPGEAAESTIDFIYKLTHEQTGTFWAPRGARDIGEAERVLGKGLPTPLELPW